MLDNVTITFSGPATAISQLLATVSTLQNGTLKTGMSPQEEDQGVPYSAPNTGALVSLSREQFRAFFEGMDAGYQQGIRLLAEKEGTVSWSELVAKGIHNPGHFKSRTSLRARKVVGSARRVQFASYFYKMEKGEEVWYLRVTPTTLASMQAYFADETST